ncbi:MAG: hypothetical protein ACTHW2_04160 [Tissierella sp.]|uniref:hypothetical protein n=1 Tax=Tissierella sp. TaxID=41274 RepID=UPI003F976D13
MKNERDKLVKVLDELMNFCFSLDMNDLKIDFNINDSQGVINIEGPCKSAPIDKLQSLEDALNDTRQPEFEEYYWPLIGGDHGYPEIELLGTFIDEGKVVFKDKYLKIYIVRKI